MMVPNFLFGLPTSLQLYVFLDGSCYHKSYFTILLRNFWVTGCGHHTIIRRLRGRDFFAGNVNKAERKIL